MKTSLHSFLTKTALIALVMSLSPAIRAQTSTADLDRDGIPNISDRDVDNDGILNSADRNIDGGTATSGPLRGRYIGDNLPNNSPREFDMDADGLADDAAAETDIDGDGLLDGERREIDIDSDGLADTAANETDIDGDGLPDDASNETDIDGDGLADGVSGEVDIDGDGTVNGFDADVDGDGLTNNSDADMHGTGVFNDILAGTEGAYSPDAAVISTAAYVGGEIRRIMGIPYTDNGLVVKISANPFGDLVTGVWRYLSADNIQVYAKWCYPANNPSDLKIAVVYRYGGPYSSDPADYTNPVYYSVSEESRVYSQYPGGGMTFVSWTPGQPAGFYFGAVLQNYTSIPSSLANGGFYYGTASEQPADLVPPYQTLLNALSAYPDLTSDPQYLTFSGNFGSAPGLTSLKPVIDLQRTVMQVSRAWYGKQEANRLR